MSAAEKAPAYKEYRTGSITTIAGKPYLLATNNSTVEIFNFNLANALVPVSELRLPQKIKDVVTVTEDKETYAIVTTGRYLYRIRITDPQNMEVILKRDAYQYSRGKIHTGAIESLATNGKVLLTSGQYGVRSIGLSNLLVEKYYYYDKSYGVTVNDKMVSVLGENVAYSFDLVTGKKVAESAIKNADKQIRHSALIGNSNYVISDNSIAKLADGKVVNYVNPAQKVNFSYAASASDNVVYYANGFGITKFDQNLKKTAFLKTSITSRFGDRSWAVGVLTAKVNGSEKIIVMNKSNILVLTPNLSLLSEYKNNDIQYNPGFTINYDYKYFMTNQAVTARMTGFLPNEMVKLTFGGRVYQVKSNNLGEAMVSFTNPGNQGRFVLEVSAPSMTTTFQDTKDVK